MDRQRGWEALQELEFGLELDTLRVSSQMPGGVVDAMACSPVGGGA